MFSIIVIMDNYYKCHACGGKVLEDHKAGELSCIDCGLVKCRTLDDFVQFKDYDDYDVVASFSSRDHKLYYFIQGHIYNLFPNNENESDISTICDFCTKHKSRSDDTVAVAIYSLKKHGLCAEKLCIYFCITISQFWQKYNDLTPETQQTPANMLQKYATHCLYQCDITETEVTKVLKTIYQLTKRVKDSPLLQKVKIDKFASNLVIIAVTINKIKINKKQLCTRLNTSFSSLRKHETLLQAILKNH